MTSNGAEALIRTLVGAGVDTCFTNPGTSEIHLVAALDDVPELRAILTLFEGVATGAADGYARMTGRPAATLLHLGPGLANGVANLHNARRARVPLLNIVGDHATHHTQYDSPLQSDIETLARNVSSWVRTSAGADHVAADALEAIAAAYGPPGQVATLIVPADVSWHPDAPPAAPRPPQTPSAVADEHIEAAVAVIRSGAPVGILLGGRVLRERGITAAARIAAATGARLFAERSAPRIERGAGLPAVERLAYWPKLASAQLEGLEDLILVDAQAPVSWFAYAGERSSLAPDACRLHVLAPPESDVLAGLEALMEALNASDIQPVTQAPVATPRPEGPLTAEKVCQMVGAMLPEGAILSDEAITSAAALPASTAGGPRHDWLTLTGGAIGQGLPVAVGAAIACPDRPVLALQADGSALYTIQSLWTMAREQLDVTVVIFNNRGYRILDTELGSLEGVEIGPRAGALVDLANPGLDFVKLSGGLGVEARRAETAEELGVALAAALAQPGPHLIEAILPAVR
jgi:acetolactate synthase I/II/III large subunit